MGNDRHDGIARRDRGKRHRYRVLLQRDDAAEGRERINRKTEDGQRDDEPGSPAAQGAARSGLTHWIDGPDDAPAAAASSAATRHGLRLGLAAAIERALRQFRRYPALDMRALRSKGVPQKIQGSGRLARPLCIGLSGGIKTARASYVEAVFTAHDRCDQLVERLTTMRPGWSMAPLEHFQIQSP